MHCTQTKSTKTQPFITQKVESTYSVNPEEN